MLLGIPSVATRESGVEILLRGISLSREFKKFASGNLRIEPIRYLRAHIGVIYFKSQHGE
jgi:hypothetical protein